MRPTICIDAGHGGKDPGAVGPTGLQEKDVALAVAMLLGVQLLPYCDVFYTRRDDKFVELGARAMIGNDGQAHAFLSIHCNSGPPGQGAGYEVFTSRGQTTSDELATDVFLAYAAEFPELSGRVDMSDGDVDKEAGFVVLTKTRMRAILFELEFIHTMRGESFLREARNQSRAARAIARGVLKHFGIATAAPAAATPAKDIGVRARLAAMAAELKTLSESL